MLFRAGLALSVTFGDTSPKGRGFGRPEGAKSPLSEIAAPGGGLSFGCADGVFAFTFAIFIICHSPQKSSVAQKVYRNRRAAAFHFFQSCVSFRMPNSLRSKPLRHLGLLRTTTCIEPTTFRRLIRHYRRSAPGMFRFSSGSARPAPSPPPPARPFGWRW